MDVDSCRPEVVPRKAARRAPRSAGAPQVQVSELRSQRAAAAAGESEEAPPRGPARGPQPAACSPQTHVHGLQARADLKDAEAKVVRLDGDLKVHCACRACVHACVRVHVHVRVRARARARKCRAGAAKIVRLGSDLQVQKCAMSRCVRGHVYRHVCGHTRGVGVRANG